MKMVELLKLNIRNLRHLLFCVLFLATQFSHARENGPSPVTPEEEKFFSFLRELSQFRFIDNLPLEPWIECEDVKDNTTFFSASLHQFTDSMDVNEKVKSWVTSFMDLAYWARVTTASCEYSIDHFNNCQLKGKFTTLFRKERIIYYHQVELARTCPGQVREESF